MYFVLGFTIVYTIAGALIGLLADASDFEKFHRYLAMGGGFIILILAVRVAAKARAPLVCKMPVLSGMAHKAEGTTSSPWELMFAGLAFATGCMTCLGAAMVIYVGLRGSMFFGASVMFLFSLGMGFPLVIAAVAMARVLPLLFRLERPVPWMGLTSGILMIGFAILLITGNYMLLTEWIYKIVGGPAIG
jgi:cytochrome c-type biogenesis protein